MNVALLSESPADEHAILELVEAVLGARVRRVQAGLRARGWPNVAQLLPPVIRHLHLQTDADVLVVVVDCDDSIVHVPEHDHMETKPGACRLCQLRAIFERVLRKLPPVEGRRSLLRGIGVAVPAVEAWYLCGREPRVSEDAWIAGQRRRHAPYTRPELKYLVYDTDRPSLQHEIDRALREVRRIAPHVERLEEAFPSFATLAHDVREARRLLRATGVVTVP